MFQNRRSKSGNRSKSGKFDILIIAVIALLIVGGLIFVLLQIVGHSEEHVDTIKNTKVNYNESLRWRPDSEICESRISQDLSRKPKALKREYTDLNLNEKCLETIGQMSKLQKLNLDRSTLQDKWLDHLTILPLRWLSLEGTPITDKAVPYLLNMRGLERLAIGDTEITDEGLEKLSEHDHLTWLCLNLDKTVTNDGIKHLGKFKHLVSVELSNPTALTGKCLANFTKPEILTSLNIDGMSISAKDLKPFSKFTNLSSLDLSNCHLTDQCMVEIAKIPSLKTLNMTGNNLTGTGLMALTKLSKLNNLRLVDCPGVDEKSLKQFRTAMPACLVHHTASSEISEKMNRRDVKQEVDFLESEVNKELEKTRSEPK